MEKLQIWQPTAFMIGMGEMQVGIFISSLIERTKPFHTIPVKVTGVNTPVMPTSRHNKRAEYVWPVLHLSSWLKTSFEDPYGGFFLAWRFETSR